MRTRPYQIVNMADSPSKKRKYVFHKTISAKKRAKKERDRTRMLSRVVVGAQIERWRDVKRRLGLASDEDVALFLLDRSVYLYIL